MNKLTKQNAYKMLLSFTVCPIVVDKAEDILTYILIGSVLHTTGSSFFVTMHWTYQITYNLRNDTNNDIIFICRMGCRPQTKMQDEINKQMDIIGNFMHIDFKK